MFNKHPKGLIPAALSNMGERFGYYIMNAVLVLFLCSKFGISEEKSTLIYSFFYAGIYLLSLVGGLIADRKQNYKGTIMAGLVVMAVGYIALSIPITANAGNTSWLLTLTCIALFFIAFGNGLFKGNLRSEEHTSELQSHSDLVCRLLLEKRSTKIKTNPRSKTPTGRR